MHGIPDRMRAARQLAGHRNVKQLADAIDKDRGLGEKVLRQIEQATRTADFTELRAIAEACELPVEWFTADLSRLAEISENPRQVIARETAEARRRSEERRAGAPAATPPLREAGPGS